MPVPAIRKRPAKTFELWNVAPATAIIWPTPNCAATSSPTTTPVSACPIPRRRPVRMNGTEPGSAMVRKSWRSDAPNDRATLIRFTSRLRTPAAVLIKIAKIAPRNATAILDSTPMPNQMMNSGSSTMRGVA